MPMGSGGGTANDMQRRDFDTGASGDAQAQFNLVAGRLEALLNQRDADVKAAMADYQADGVSDEYAGKEQRWYNVGDQVRAIIVILRSSLGGNDETAGWALQQAAARVAAIG